MNFNYKQQSMRDFAENNFKDPDAKPTFYFQTEGERMTAEERAKFNENLLKSSIAPDSYWQDRDKDIEEYNTNLVNLDPSYQNIIPFNRILVRMFHIVAERTPTGLIIEPKIPMKEITQNGIGIRQTMNSPWPYMRKGIVVATPENDPWLKPGDIVEVDKHAVLALKPAVDHPPVLEHGFTASTWTDTEPPTDLKNPHYGYLLIDYRLILGKVKKNG